MAMALRDVGQAVYRQLRRGRWLHLTANSGAALVQDGESRGSRILRRGESIADAEADAAIHAEKSEANDARLDFEAD